MFYQTLPNRREKYGLKLLVRHRLLLHHGHVNVSILWLLHINLSLDFFLPLLTVVIAHIDVMDVLAQSEDVGEIGLDGILNRRPRDRFQIHSHILNGSSQGAGLDGHSTQLNSVGNRSGFFLLSRQEKSMLE